jgi:hypothetical protein
MSDRKERKFLSEAEICEVRALRAAGENTYDIAAAYGISQATVSRMTKDIAANKPRAAARVTPTSPAPAVKVSPAARPAAATEAVKTCPHCGETLPAKARFCFMCGKVPKTEREQLIERVERLTSAFKFVPDNQRDEAICTINATLSFLRKTV